MYHYLGFHFLNYGSFSFHALEPVFFIIHKRNDYCNGSAGTFIANACGCFKKSTKFAV